MNENTTPYLHHQKFDKTVAALSAIIFAYFVFMYILAIQNPGSQLFQFCNEILTIPMLLGILVLFPLSIYQWYKSNFSFKSFAVAGLVFICCAIFAFYSLGKH